MDAQLGWVSSMAVASAAVLLGLAWFGQLYGFVFRRRTAAPARETEAADPKVPAMIGTGARWDVRLEPAGRPTSMNGPADPPTTALPVRISGSFLRVAAAFLVAGCVARGIAAGRVPWGNMYEFAITATAALVVGHVIIQRRRPELRLGLAVPAVAVIMLGLAMTVYVPVAPLVPALRSYWLVLHVLAAALSGACFVLAGITSVSFLIGGRRRTSDAVRQTELDRLAARLTAFAFPIWTFGALLAGPIWAEYAWGRYWGWDPKEVWALVTWIVFAAYLHARATAGWRGRRAAVLSVIGALSFVFNYVGVNLFFAGLHSYAGI
ncbi:c-type cytochrome biogenesis protein CcsB [Microlunatus sp. GCM10028923]|uniref:c-type cytochrome biogenesis protein CcsB n=1 Tax=Microlunatus sp. GCM10028923 TaxID=3273400 RepID=UPI0036120AE9